MDLNYELRKCKECSCSRCVLNGTRECYIEIAIKELDRYDQAMDSMRSDTNPGLVVNYVNNPGLGVFKEEN